MHFYYVIPFQEVHQPIPIKQACILHINHTSRVDLDHNNAFLGLVPMTSSL